MTVEFGPVTRQTVAEQVRARLAERIASGELAPGSPVPAERTLSDLFGRTAAPNAEGSSGGTNVVSIPNRRSVTFSNVNVPPYKAEDDTM